MRYQTGFSMKKKRLARRERIAGVAVALAAAGLLALLAVAGDWIAAHAVVPLFGVGRDPAAQSVMLPALTVYGVQTGRYETALQARQAAQALRARGGAGYADSENRVFASVYQTEEEAVAVADRLRTQGYQTAVYTIESADTVCCAVAEDALRERLCEQAAFLPWLCRRLAELCLAQDRAVLTETRLRVELSALREQVLAEEADFSQIPDRRALSAALRGVLEDADLLLAELAQSVDAPGLKHACLALSFAYVRAVRQAAEGG